jgi:predicted house-cleaning noncanonical NTP pyrophosphatase (MazG superfamily)
MTLRVGHGPTPNTRTVYGRELGAALRAKLTEEADELQNAEGDYRIAELADVLEVVRGIARHLGISMDTLAEVADAKRKERGGFEPAADANEASC